jgi:hypothetical protein
MLTLSLSIGLARPMLALRFIPYSYGLSAGVTLFSLYLGLSIRFHTLSR